MIDQAGPLQDSKASVKRGIAAGLLSGAHELVGNLLAEASAACPPPTQEESIVT